MLLPMSIDVPPEVLEQVRRAADRLGVSETEFCRRAIVGAAGQILARRRLSKDEEDAFWNDLPAEERRSEMHVLDAGLSHLEKEHW
jgi:uncharacterized protein (DUF1778 family)